MNNLNVILEEMNDDILFTFDESMRNTKTLLRLMKEDYDDLVDLRNRLHDGTDDDTTIYEEDHITLDHILNYIEYFYQIIKEIKKNESKN